MRKSIICIIAVAGMAAGCATAPEKIEPVSVGQAAYEALSCPQIAQEQVRLSGELSTMSAAQRRARAIDTVGVALVGLPAASIFGSSHTRDIARLKGEQEAAHRQSVASSCGAGAAPGATNTP
jgi:starvation-inducible outer membrane lipoprotein